MRTNHAQADLDHLRADALFASPLQRFENPTLEAIRQAVTTTVNKIGANGCACVVAQEFGEYPDCAPARMQWACDAVREAFLTVPA